jgi:hypothetical protein
MGVIRTPRGEDGESVTGAPDGVHDTRVRVSVGIAEGIARDAEGGLDPGARSGHLRLEALVVQEGEDRVREGVGANLVPRAGEVAEVRPVHDAVPRRQRGIAHGGLHVACETLAIGIQEVLGGAHGCGCEGTVVALRGQPGRDEPCAGSSPIHLQKPEDGEGEPIVPEGAVAIYRLDRHEEGGT